MIRERKVYIGVYAIIYLVINVWVNKSQVEGEATQNIAVPQKLWTELLHGKTVQFFILENVAQTIREYAEENYGNGVNDLTRGWKEAARKAEYAVIEYYLDDKLRVWERIRLVCGKKSYIIIQYAVGPVNRCDPSMLGFDKMIEKFEYGYATPHTPRTPEEFLHVFGEG